MSDTIELDFGATAQKRTEGGALPVVLLALDQGRYDMDRSLDELRALAEANAHCILPGQRLPAAHREIPKRNRLPG